MSAARAHRSPGPPRARGWARRVRAGLVVAGIAAGATVLGALGPSAVVEAGTDLGERLRDRLGTQPIRAVRVGGELEHVSRERLEAIIRPHLRHGFFGVDVDALAREARELPWVGSVSVRRVWPDTLHVAILERRAVARWKRGGLIGPDGSVFDSAGVAPDEGLPLLDGPDGSAAEVWLAWREIRARLGAIGGGAVGLSVSDRGIWRIACADGLEIVLREGQLADLVRLTRIYSRIRPADDRRLAAGGAQTASPVRIARIDLRYPNGFAVRWAGLDQGLVSE